MPVTVVVGGQFGSEGKGKVAFALAKELKAQFVIRVGGANSGHTVIHHDGTPVIFRHLPTASLLPTTRCVIPAGSYLHEPTLLNELATSRLPAERLAINPFAVMVVEDDALTEARSGLSDAIGSTGSGTGAAVLRRIARTKDVGFAKDIPSLRPFICDTSELLRKEIAIGARVLIEGTQGFGLSLLHSDQFPFCTSRDTTAGAFVSEAGLSPLDVDQVVVVIRAFPIRVTGNSGTLPNETTWNDVTQQSGSKTPLREYTSVTKRLRRVARFDSQIVRRALVYNRPTRIVLNHVDFIDAECVTSGVPSAKCLAFVRSVEDSIGQRVDDIGLGPSVLVRRDPQLRRVASHDE